MYHAANVSGPSEFGDLPLSDQQFWLSWMDERLRRDSDQAEEISDQIDARSTH